MRYRDRIDAVAFESDSRHRYLNAALSADWTDAFLAGGRNLVQVEHQAGRVHLDTPAVEAADAAGLRVQGAFRRERLRLERLQALSQRASILLSLSMQWASKNLDLGRELQISGADGVRAYPKEELIGDEGYIATAEYRYVIPAGDRWRWGLAAFLDAGRARIDKNPLPGTVENVRSLSGYGFSVAAGVPEVFSAELTLAWRADEAPVTDPDRRPRAWFVLTRFF